MKSIYLFILAACISFSATAQTRFFSTVKIEFEKTLAVHQLFKEIEPEWYERIKDHMPAQNISYYDFIGDTTQSIYKPGREVAQNTRNFFGNIADNNVVYNNYKTETTISQKPVFEETFLVQDSLADIKWKLTADTRTIAGYECRKAIGTLNDSITVFAFYTDELLVTGGPEGIHGLPGMILGVGVPRIHTTWFATKVEVFDVNMNVVKPATKGKKVNRADMIELLDKVLKQWGPYGNKLVINYMI